MIISDNYKEIERLLLDKCLNQPDFRLEDTQECIGIGFTLTDPENVDNGRSNYDYANEFYRWMRSGDTDLSEKIKEMNPFAKKFVDSTGLPETFSSTYGAKINRQLPIIIRELFKEDSRRAYLNILLEKDQIILESDNTHEYPCTIGISLIIRNIELIMVVNMRSNNIFSVLPYDVYNFTNLQRELAEKLGVAKGKYVHFINSCHIYNRDINKIKEYLNMRL